MASAGLKRPSSSDVPSHSGSNQLSPNSYWAANKRRCTTQMAQQQRLFRDPAALIGPLSDDVALLIKNEVSKQQQQQQQQQQHHHHHSHHHSQQQLHQHHHNHPNQQHHHQHQQHTHNQHHNQQSHPQQDHQLQSHPSTSIAAAAAAAIGATANPAQHNQSNLSNTNSALSPDTPVLSIRQAQAIFEKLIKEREQKLREEYDKILISKLSEQYDTFVKYTHDHIERRYNETNSHQASYLS